MNDQFKPTKIQLWQFLLELLTEKQHRNIIRWNNEDGEFEFLEPGLNIIDGKFKFNFFKLLYCFIEKVASLWGQLKGNPNMNYSKMSRALRSYYSTGIISKISSQQYSYKFMFDLKTFLGYSVQELSNL